MKYQVFGQEYSAGVFTPDNAKEAINYSNVLLYVIALDDPISNGKGKRSLKIKIKSNTFDSLTNSFKGKLPLIGQFIDLCDHVIDVSYNQYGSITKLDIIK